MRHFLAARLMLMSLVETRKKLSVKEVRAEIPLGYKIKLENVLPIFFYYLEPPIITSKPPTQVSVVQGSTLSLCCEATGSPPPKVQWSRVHRSSDSTQASQQKGCLEINPVRYNSDGDYMCQAKNRFGLAETTTTVIVTMKS